jgi:hypothetical protein
MQTKCAPFLTKLWQMLKEESKIISWEPDGESFVVKSQKAMESNILCKYFRSNQFSTFNRQLNYFGFKKLGTQNKWCHELFNRSNPHDMLLIKRKVNTGNEHKKRRDGDHNKKRKRGLFEIEEHSCKPQKKEPTHAPSPQSTRRVPTAPASPVDTPSFSSASPQIPAVPRPALVILPVNASTKTKSVSWPDLEFDSDPWLRALSPISPLAISPRNWANLDSSY